MEPEVFSVFLNDKNGVIYGPFMHKKWPFLRRNPLGMKGKRIALLTPKRGEFCSIFQYFLDERAYWNTSFLSSPSSGDALFVIFGNIMSYLLPFVNKKLVRGAERMGGMLGLLGSWSAYGCLCGTLLAPCSGLWCCDLVASGAFQRVW